MSALGQKRTSALDRYRDVERNWFRLLDAPAFLRRGLLDRDSDHLGAWGTVVDHMILAAYDELQRVVARREL